MLLEVFFVPQVKFETDPIDETDLLEETLKPRVENFGGNVEKVVLRGNHMTPCIQVLLLASGKGIIFYYYASTLEVKKKVKVSANVIVFVDVFRSQGGKLVRCTRQPTRLLKALKPYPLMRSEPCLEQSLTSSAPSNNFTSVNIGFNYILWLLWSVNSQYCLLFIIVGVHLFKSPSALFHILLTYTSNTQILNLLIRKLTVKHI